VRPVRFRYNGRAGTPAGQESVGVLGQEIEKVFPEMIRRVPGGLDGEPDVEDLRIYDGSALPFVLVNAVKELAGKVEQLEQALAEAHKERGSDGTSGAEPALTPLSQTVPMPGTLPISRHAPPGKFFNNRKTLTGSKITFPSVAPNVRWLRFWVPLFALLLCGHASGECPDTPNPKRDIDLTCPATQQPATYASAGPQTINDQIALCPPPPGTANVKWDLGPDTFCIQSTTDPAAIVCGSMTIKAPAPPGMSAPVGSPVIISGTTPDVGIFRVKATDFADSNKFCERSYTFHRTATGGGWGDPHITTVDGVHYDFQSAGEFTALRGDGLEIQTRQTPVATTSLPGANPYTGLATCVAVYSAVATRVCNHRVSYQPNISGVPDPSGLQLRVDGQLTTLGPNGIDLSCGGGLATHLTPGGRIVKSPAGDGIEIHYPDGTLLVVTPAWWPDQQKWYLNVNVYGTTATEGIFGKLAKDSWLPALPDGTSLGSKPEALDQRYQDLYGKFANAWRVTDGTSLFDYAPGTNTATFTVPDWPRFNKKSCLIPGQTPAQPTTQQIAAQACNGITDAGQKANCTFDVAVTGNTGFAQTYATSQEFRPHGPGWQPVLAGVGIPTPTPSPSWPWWWWILLLVLVLIIVLLIARKKKTV